MTEAHAAAEARSPGPTQYQELVDFVQNVGKDPARLIFEDELTGIGNRRFLLSYLEHKIDWGSGGDYPLSLLIVDLDRFKQINDTRGHDVGDQVLTWVAALLKETAGDGGMPIRYGGDEFMVLIPGGDREAGREMAERILEATAARPFRIRDTGAELTIGLSVGVATAPEDGKDGRSLFCAADTALYHAKQSGRNQAATTADVDPEKVFAKTALYRLAAAGIVGRDQELSTVSGALEGLAAGKDPFVVFDGPPGSGKTTFLETVEENLANHDVFYLASAAGADQEGRRPYYLATRILTQLLNRHDDKGASLLAELDESRLAGLSHVLPGLDEHRPPDGGEEGDDVERRAIFDGLTGLLSTLLAERSVVLLLDDLQFADEASLHVLRSLLRDDAVRLCVCGTLMDSAATPGQDRKGPVGTFLSIWGDELGLERATLRPLSAADVGRHLHRVFPGLRAPESFEELLADATNGNPLFLSELIRSLVSDGKVALVGKNWVVGEIDQDELPQSLDELVNKQIAALDTAERAMLQRASVLGEDVPLSMLTGSSRGNENQILEFLDRAQELGLVKLDFHDNDGTVRFLGKRVLEISYSGMEEKQLASMHEEVGAYQESLYEQHVLPSASQLAHHFERAANDQKSRLYQEIEVANNERVFDAAEAAQYVVAGPIEDEETDEDRLAPESARHLPEFFRALSTAVRNIRLYPAGSNSVVVARGQVMEALRSILEHSEYFRLSLSKGFLLANGQRIDISTFRNTAQALQKLLAAADLQSIVFQRGIADDELSSLLSAIERAGSEPVGRDHWKAFLQEQPISHIELQQVRYAEIRRVGVKGPAAAAGETGVRPEALEAMPRVLRAFRGAAKSTKLYPTGSVQVCESVEEILGAIAVVFEHHRSLSFAVGERTLLANGVRLTLPGRESLVAGFVEFLRDSGLESVGFAQGLTAAEMETFFAAIGDLPGDVDKKYWEKVAEKHGLKSIFFNQRRYELGLIETVLNDELADDDGGPDWADRIESDPQSALRQALPRFGKDLLAQGEHDLVAQLMKRLYRDFADLERSERLQTIHATGTLIDSLVLALQYKFSKVGVDSLIGAVQEETDPNGLHELTVALNLLAGTALQFADYQLAGWIFQGLRDRREELLRSDDKQRQQAARLVASALDPAVQSVLEADLTSGDPKRQENAAQILGPLGSPGIPLLIEVIKQEKDFRCRQMAATLLAEMGPKAGRQIKKSLNLEVTVEQRFRILEVIDVVTRDVRDELAFGLGDKHPKIRRAAFRLADRLRDDALVDVLLPFAAEGDVNLQKGIVRSLAQLGSPAAVEAIGSILERTNDADLGIACCQALGKSGDALAIGPLGRVVTRRKYLLFGNYWEHQVRATAALALRQIRDPQATSVLANFSKDSDPRVRQLSREASGEEPQTKVEPAA